MKMSPLTFFCENCGAANSTEDTACFACQEPLQFSFSAGSTSSPAPAPLTASTPQATSGQLFPGSLLHKRYEVVGEVGQGGFSVVYAAKDTKQKHKKVAIKQINLRAMKPRQVIDATDTYNREVKLLSRLKHVNLPRVYDHFTDADHWYLVMDFIEGETLEDYVLKAREGHLPVKEVLKIGNQLCIVLNYLHMQIPPVIFRDVKPSNIMRTPKGRLYLIDFGIARHFTPGQNKDTGPLGSPGYAAPEQYGTAQTTAQADIYSLGATLEALLSGHDPLDPSPSPVQPLPKKLRQLLDNMLDPEARKRPSAMEVRSHLAEIKLGHKGKALSFVWGLLIGSMPYSLIALMLFSMASLPELNTIAVVNTVFISLYILLLCTWPFVLVGQLIAAIRFLFSPPRRWMGLGMLTMLVFIVIAMTQAWLPYPISSFLGFFN
jgi:serine/threonine protein kinase